MTTNNNSIQQIRNRLQTDLRRLIEHELEAENRAGPYILLAVADPGVTLDSDIRGITCPSMSEIYADSIENYQGPGPAMILQHDLPIAEFTAVAVHELTHRLMAETLCNESPSQAYAEAARQCIGRSTWQDFGESDTVEAELLAAREAHGLPFIRMMIHVASRMDWRRWPIDTFELLDWREVTNTPSFEFFETLRYECHALRNEPLSVVKALPPPAEFGSLFEPVKNFRPRF
ncbi:hypothetical protein [Fuerstiella marisgermanici]|uniref:Uncharacterized protein n=1 Tax=Fuerstiella marisgermanici TaxID=1891926 RepID=A0A1P8WS95_9PLAN|nr:hypothetical protein [Fuerstiella marisgermanici]APZ96930.1 hypothetical protein Fuma_06606 [Fuerstiella marisgermanici]